jgi:RNA polymerase sigma-70 factor, ECF subfamily
MGPRRLDDDDSAVNANSAEALGRPRRARGVAGVSRREQALDSGPQMKQGETKPSDDGVRQLLAEGRGGDAAAALMRAYGSEVYSFLAALHRSEQDASDVFSMFAEGVLRGLPGFAWECSLRTWLYAVARRSSLRHRRDAGRRGARMRPLPDGSALSGVVEEVRSRTQTFLRTERRTRLEALRGSLPEADQELLLLRVGRQLAWDEIARIVLGEGDAMTEEVVKREAARLRKRFQLVKAQLRAMAEREGLVSGAGESEG